MTDAIIFAALSDLLLLVDILAAVLGFLVAGVLTFSVAAALLLPCWVVGWLMSRLLPARFRYG